MSDEREIHSGRSCTVSGGRSRCSNNTSKRTHGLSHSDNYNSIQMTCNDYRRYLSDSKMRRGDRRIVASDGRL